MMDLPYKLIMNCGVYHKELGHEQQCCFSCPICSQPKLKGSEGKWELKQ